MGGVGVTTINKQTITEDVCEPVHVHLNSACYCYYALKLFDSLQIYR